MHDIDRNNVPQEDSIRLKSIVYEAVKKTGYNIWERMLGDDGKHQEEDCHHVDEDVSGIVGVSRRDHMGETGSHG